MLQLYVAQWVSENAAHLKSFELAQRCRKGILNKYI